MNGRAGYLIGELVDVAVTHGDWFFYFKLFEGMVDGNRYVVYVAICPCS